MHDDSQNVFDFVSCGQHLLVGSKRVSKASEYIILLLRCCLKTHPINLATTYHMDFFILCSTSEMIFKQ